MEGETLYNDHLEVEAYSDHTEKSTPLAKTIKTCMYYKNSSACVECVPAWRDRGVSYEVNIVTMTVVRASGSVPNLTMVY